MIDYDKIISPFNGPDICGPDLREDDKLSIKYSDIKSLRSSLRRAERGTLEADGNTDISGNNDGWTRIISLTKDILANDSKDFEVAIWLLEGLVRVRGFDGFKIGLDIIFELLNNYDLTALNPKITDLQDFEQIEDFLLPITMLNGRYELGTIISAIYFCPLIPTSDNNFHNAWELKKILEDEVGGQNITKAMLLEAESMRSIIFSINNEEFAKLRTCFIDSIDSFAKLNALLSKKFASAAPSLVNIDKVLQYCNSLIVNIHKIITDNQKSSAVATDDAIETSKPNNGNILDLSLLENTSLDKEQALQLMKLLIKFFEANEMHSPVPYLLSRALHWSQSKLPEILCDIIPDEDQRMSYCEFSGVPFIRTNNN